MSEDVDIFDNLCCVVLYQVVICCDIGFVFGGVNDQCFNFIFVIVQFIVGGEVCVVEVSNVKLVDMFDQCFMCVGLIVVLVIVFDLVVFVVGVNDYVYFCQC